MSVGLRISTKGNLNLAPLRRRITDPKGLLNVAGRSGRNFTQRHLRNKNRSSPNKLGGARTNYYAKAADAVNYRLLSDDSVVVSINAIGIALRFHGTAGLPGGVLRPVTAEYLTIPVAPEAHGKRAREFNDLEVAFAHDPKTGRDRLALVKRVANLLAYKRRKVNGVFKRIALPGGKQGGEPIFWLQKTARQAGDDTVLPTEDDLLEHVLADYEEFLGLQDERA